MRQISVNYMVVLLGRLAKVKGECFLRNDSLLILILNFIFLTLVPSTSSADYNAYSKHQVIKLFSY